MEVIELKSNVNWVTHILHSLKPLQENNSEKVFKIESDYRYELIRDDFNSSIIGISMSYGPTLMVGEIHPQLVYPIKEICPAYDSEGNFLYMTLVLDYDISGNNETGIVS